MNIPSQISLYDLLTMILPGFVILWIIGFCGLNPDIPLECAFVIILSYPVGMIYHRIIETLFNRSKRIWEQRMLQDTWNNENSKLIEGMEKRPREIRKNDYNKAYYRIAQANCLMNIPTLEAQETFLRNSFVLMLISAGKVCCCYNNETWRCHVVILLLVLSITVVFIWCFTQRKIFSLVWEGDNYIQHLNSKANENEIE